MASLERFLIISLFIFSQLEFRDGKLIFLQYIFRHGDRSPKVSFPGDLTPPDFWPRGYGKLSQLGKKQHYKLGKFIRNMYKDFISSSPNEVMLNSTDMERCLESGLSHVASLYAPTAQWMFVDNFNWQPITVHYTPKEKDKYLSVDSICPRAFEEEKRIFKSNVYLQMLETFQSTFQMLTNNLGYYPSPLEVYNIYDSWFTQKLYNKILPDWVELIYNDMSLLSMSTLFHYTESVTLQRLRIGPLLGKMIDDMKKKISGEMSHLNVQVYSGRYQHILFLLNALKVYNHLPCPYCATLIFELHQSAEGANTVRLLHLNSTAPESGHQAPNVLVLEGCAEYCPLEYFVNYTRHVVPENWEAECGLLPENVISDADRVDENPDKWFGK